MIISIPDLSRRGFLKGIIALGLGTTLQWPVFVGNEDGGVQLGESRADSFSDDSLKILMRDLEITWEDMRREVLNAGLDGCISWTQAEQIIVKINAAEASA